MKIRSVSQEYRSKVYALLRASFPGSNFEASLVQQLHEKGRPLREWICIHTSKVIAYIGFTNAYHGDEICGLHLGPMAVAPEFQLQGVGSELLRFALRQKAIQSQPLFVLGHPGYYQRFGFEPCSSPICPFDRNNKHFLGLRNNCATPFVVGYEPEFKPEAQPPGLARAKTGRRR